MSNQPIPPDFTIFFKTQPEIESYFSFKDFFKVFLLGDLRHMLDISTFGYGRTVADGLDPGLLEDPDLREKYLGDPIKTAMLIQILRRFPYLTAIPAIFALSLFIASFAKFTIPFIRRFSNIMDKFLPPAPARRKRDTVAMEGIRHIPEHLKELGRTLSEGMLAVEYLALKSIEEKDGLRSPVITKRSSTLFDSYDKRKARLAISGVSDVGKIIRSWLQAWVDMLPRVSMCSGQLIGCHVRYAFWATPCKPFGPVINCVSVFGKAIGVVLHYTTKFLGDGGRDNRVQAFAPN